MLIKPNSYYWEIETVWERFFLPEKPKKDYSKILKNYDKQGKSRFHPSFFYVQDLSDDVFIPSDNFVFEDEYLKKYKGLLKYSVFKEQKTGKFIYLIDNHHQALYSFLEFFLCDKDPLTVVHIDAHRDNAKCLNKIFTSLDFSNIVSQINNCRVSDYLDVAEKTGIIKKVYNITQTSEFKKFIGIEESFILNLDIDIFGPEGDAVETKLKTEKIAKAWSKADGVIIATSPGFIDYSHAKRIIDFFLRGK